jgi:hypothetical protein
MSRPLPGWASGCSRQATRWRWPHTTELIDALHRVTSGRSVIDPQVVAQVLHRRRTHNPLERLTEREQQVLALAPKAAPTRPSPNHSSSARKRWRPTSTPSSTGSSCPPPATTTAESSPSWHTSVPADHPYRWALMTSPGIPGTVTPSIPAGAGPGQAGVNPVSCPWSTFLLPPHRRVRSVRAPRHGARSSRLARLQARASLATARGSRFDLRRCLDSCRGSV